MQHNKCSLIISNISAVAVVMHLILIYTEEDSFNKERKSDLIMIRHPPKYGSHVCPSKMLNLAAMC